MPATYQILEADDPAHLISGFCGSIEDFTYVLVRIEWLSFDDSDRGKHPKPIGIGKVWAFAVKQQLQLVERRGITSR
jgi:hypothetical protein